MRKIILLSLVLILLSIGFPNCSGFDNNPMGQWQAGPQLTPAARMVLIDCLNKNKVTLYTAIWCGPCKIQKSYFGPEFKHLKNVIYCDRQADDDPIDDPCRDIRHVPTWKLADGTYIHGLQNLNKLAEKTGCSLKSCR